MQFLPKIIIAALGLQLSACCVLPPGAASTASTAPAAADIQDLHSRHPTLVFIDDWKYTVPKYFILSQNRQPNRTGDAASRTEGVA
jgi:hypothetical protein